MQMVRIINCLQTLSGYDVLKSMVGSGFVGQDELTEALRAFGEHSAYKITHDALNVLLKIVIGLHVAAEHLATMIARLDSTGRGVQCVCMSMRITDLCASIRRDQYG
jgi:hypothetical protein